MINDHVVVAEIERNKLEKIRITRGSYKETQYLDIRLFFLDPKDGELRPTKKGLTLPVKLLPELIKGLQQAEGVSV